MQDEKMITINSWALCFCPIAYAAAIVCVVCDLVTTVTGENEVEENGGQKDGQQDVQQDGQ